MKELPARFSAPISTARPRASRLIEAYSPKLSRRVQLFDHASFAVWIGLEASPTVTSLCERPARLGSAANDPVIDFWARHDGVEVFLIAAPDDAAHAWPDHVDGISLRFVRPADRAAAGIWIANWQRMLPVINACRSMASRSLMKAVHSFVRAPTPLAIIERQFSIGDPTVVRGTIFELLRAGQLSAPTLRTESLSLHTMMEPAA